MPIIDAVQSGDLSVSVAGTLSSATPEKQRDAIGNKAKKGLLAAAREIKSESNEQNALPKAHTPIAVADISAPSSPTAQEVESLIQEIGCTIEAAY
jgi:hypothetical protein